MIFGIGEPAFLISLVVVAAVIYLRLRMYGYWEKRGIPFLQPRFSLGNIPKYVTTTLDEGKFYDEIKKKKYKLSGIFNILWPTLVVIHPDYITDILSEYLHGHFVEKGFYYSKKEDKPQLNLRVLDGKNWKDMRTKLTPDYDTEEMKYMFGAVLTISGNIIEAIERHAVDGRDIDVKEFLACYTSDFIRHSVYNLRECNGFKHSETDSHKKNWGFLQTGISNIIGFIQEVQTMLGLRPAVDDDTYYYYAIREDMKHREENEDCHVLTRLMEMLFEVDESVINTQYPEILLKIMTRAFDFFKGSFDTSSTTMYFAIYELCRNPDIQDRLRNEINEVLGRHGGKITANSLRNMKYLQQVIDETLRMYPPVPNRIRICIKDYTLRDTEMTIPEGARVVIPIFSLHRDGEYYPDAEKFDPDRFNKKARHSLYMPFGQGSTDVSGIHLTLLQAKIGLIRILRKFVLRISPTTKMPLQLDPQTFLRSTTNLYIQARKI